MTVQAVEAFSPYSNTTPFTAGLPTWMSPQDAERINAYQIYEQIYWNVPETFKLTFRGEDNASPIYVPTARTIVDTTSRYIAVSPAFLVDPDLGTDVEREQCRLMFRSLFRRERFWSKFQSNKLYGFLRGDWCWHIIANPLKPPGRRLKIEALDPGAYFPVSHPNDPDRIIAVHIVEQVQDEEDNVFIKRQTYTRGADPVNNMGDDTTIYNSIGLFDIDEWQALDDKAITVVKPPTALPPQITTIPVYHIPNIQTPGDPFGSSELRGFERVLAAINQAISDEELALALEGLGMYETDGGPPRDEANRITDWILGPGRVVEHAPGSKFSRVTGVANVSPVQEHLKFLIDSLRDAAAVPSAATGAIDVQVAESGIARYMRLHPLLAKKEVREEVIMDVHTQMFWDLREWFAAYEGFETPCIVQPVFGDPVPVDQDAEIERVLKIADPTLGIADANWARAQLEKFGYEFDGDIETAILNAAQARARATDPFAARMQDDQEVVQEGAGGE